MIGTSTFEYGLIRVSIFAIRAITPLSILYCIVRPFFSVGRRLLPLDIWCAAESLFYVLFYLPLKARSQCPATHPPATSRQERQELFARCVQNIPDPEAYLARWSKDAPLSEIKRENTKDFLAWAFLNTEKHGDHENDELEDLVSQIETSIKRKIPPGRGTADCLRLTTDAVRMQHRPLVWYLIVFAVDCTTHLWFLWSSFSYHRTSLASTITTFPPRPLTALTTKVSPSKTISYWLRPHKSTTKHPIVFLHGIGIGLLTYIPFLASLPNDIGIIAIEILPISFRITSASLRTADMMHQLHAITQHHGFDTFVLASHSYGSVITTHLLKDPAISPHIASVVLVDPVSLLLHLPDVAYNFTYRAPRQANEWQLWYFASTDMGVAHALARGFFWADNILWKEDLGGRRCSVFLAGRDLIVPVGHVWRYLVEGDAWCEGSDACSVKPDVWDDGEKLKLFWAEELDHAQIFDSKGRRKVLVGEVLEHCDARLNDVAALRTRYTD